MRYWLFIIALVFVGCQDVKRPEKPENLIPKDKMVDILTEAYLANAAQSIRNKAVFGEEIRLDSLVYAKFGIDSLQFARSNAYYATDVNTYVDIFQKIELKLNQYEKGLDSIREKSKAYRDSISEQIRTQRGGKE